MSICLRPNIHIDDLVDLYVFFLRNNKKLNGVFNAGFENLSIKNIAEKISKKIKSKILVLKNINDKRSYRVDSTKLLKLGFQPKKNVQVAIDEIINYYQNKKNKAHSNCYSINWLKKKINFFK